MRRRTHILYVCTSVGDPDPDVFGPLGSGSISQRYESGFGSFPFPEIMLAK